jgi:Tfp pilus assembly protein PilO
MNKYRITIIILLALLAVSASGFLFTVVRGTLQDLALRKRLQGQSAFQLQQKEFAELQEEHAAWKQLPADLRAFRKDQIISMDDFARFRRDLNSCLDDNGLLAENISFQFGRVRRGIRMVSIGFLLDAPYRSLKKFIYEMEKKPGMQCFERIELNAAPDTVKGRFAMEVYLAE